MDQPNSIKLFKENNIRYVWDEEKEDRYFSVLDLISFLTDCSNPEEYIKEMLSRDEGLRHSWNTICIPVQMPGDDGKSHEVLSVNTQGLFRIIQSVPSIKAEPFKNFLAEMGAERLNQMQNPRTFEENVQCAFSGGSVAAVARQSLEKELGHSVISSLNTKASISEQTDIKKLDVD